MDEDKQAPASAEAPPADAAAPELDARPVGEEVKGHAFASLDKPTETKAKEDESRIVTGVASSQNMDRDDDVIPMEAWNLADVNRAIARGMPMFFSHMQRGLPIGKVTKVWKDVEAGVLRFRGALMPEGMFVLADQVWSMMKGGFLNAVSIGFISRDYEWIEGAGRKFKSLELLEISVVPIPANRDALVTQLSQAKAFEGTYDEVAFAKFVAAGVPALATTRHRRRALERDIELLRLGK
jgi:HK97 family phage prohead protease